MVGKEIDCMNKEQAKELLSFHSTRNGMAEFPSNSK
nr:MAG TPA: hypothetical protein [Caudoviricetes sp.]